MFSEGYQKVQVKVQVIYFFPDEYFSSYLTQILLNVSQLKYLQPVTRVYKKHQMQQPPTLGALSQHLSSGLGARVKLGEGAWLVYTNIHTLAHRWQTGRGKAIPRLLEHEGRGQVCSLVAVGTGQETVPSHSIGNSLNRIKTSASIQQN